MSIFYRFQDSGLDDWDVANNYMQMGFRPGFAIQARELTQMQTILQSQITALARRSLISGSIIDSDVGFIPVGGGFHNGSIGQGYIYIEPTEKSLGYFVHINNTINFSAINVDDDNRTVIYLVYEEIQINPDGSPFPAGGGYAEVRVDTLLKDNAQGYSNYSAPGSSRYQINIIAGGSYIEGQGVLPTNAVKVVYFDPDSSTWKYNDTNLPI